MSAQMPVWVGLFLLVLIVLLLSRFKWRTPKASLSGAYTLLTDALLALIIVILAWWFFAWIGFPIHR